MRILPFTGTVPATPEHAEESKHDDFLQQHQGEHQRHQEDRERLQPDRDSGGDGAWGEIESVQHSPPPGLS